MNDINLMIKEIETKSILTKSNLPIADYSVNPYGGCEHACKYCYASFMKRIIYWLCDGAISAVGGEIRAYQNTSQADAGKWVCSQHSYQIRFDCKRFRLNKNLS